MRSCGPVASAVAASPCAIGFPVRRALPSAGFGISAHARYRVGKVIICACARRRRPRALRRTRRCCAIRRYLHELLRSRKRARRAQRPASPRATPCTSTQRRRSSSMLRTDVSFRGAGRRGEGGGAQHDRCAAAASAAWRGDRRPGARHVCSVCATNFSTTVSARTRNCWRQTR